jgi:hypothetical protein
MMDFADAGFRDRLSETLNRHEGFALETRWFDGSVVLEAGESKCWLKIYRGRIIETLDSIPPFGFTFRLRGTRDAWEDLVSGRSRFADLIMPGKRNFEGDPSLASASASAPPRIAIEGNLLEATRIYEALFHLADCLCRIAK